MIKYPWKDCQDELREIFLAKYADKRYTLLGKRLIHVSCVVDGVKCGGFEFIKPSDLDNREYEFDYWDYSVGVHFKDGKTI